MCEAQREIGETALNEASSRSHQILRLTIESSVKQYLGRSKSSTLVSCVNFVDLAGSERASQTASAGMRLKEGSHINRSLLTLGKVVRQLSKGRNGHIPYRDSKLTRILQSSLGGNARTAIVCTMSPAHTHIEQSRNTLLFATCAKEVVTNAQLDSFKTAVSARRVVMARGRFSNYLLQTAVEHGTHMNRYIILERIKTNLVGLSRHQHGHYVVQSLFVKTTGESEGELLRRLIKAFGNLDVAQLIELVRDPFASHALSNLLDTARIHLKGRFGWRLAKKLASLQVYQLGLEVGNSQRPAGGVLLESDGH
ncbi:hypothetical protein ZWY2020_009689 [Hordeum vulgare]|nr:hypothetical protein ZWY2020_009689 [Hordeum vulgare]